MLKTHLPLVLCLGLVACGGGGGGIPPIITSGNYLTVAQEALSSSKYLLDTSALANGPPPATGSCPGGGSIAVTVHDVNGNGKLDAGDSFTMDMTRCQYPGMTLDGSLAVSVNTLAGDMSTNIYALGASLTFTNLTTTTAASTTSGNGIIGLALSSRGLNDQTASITSPSLVTLQTYANVSQSLTLTNVSVTQTLTPTGTGFSSSFAASGSFGSSAFNNNSLTLTNITPFVRSSTQNYPASGQLVVADATHRQVRMTALDSTRVQIEVDAGANGRYDLSVTKLWSELL